MQSCREMGGGGKIPRSLSPGDEVKPRVPQMGKVVIPGWMGGGLV